jgi:transposase
LERALREIERLREENERLRQQLEAALRMAKRQAAPHSRGKPLDHPKRPGRKPGAAYGRQASRPRPQQVDEAIAVPLPSSCPRCGGSVESERIAPQYPEDIVRRTVGRRFDIALGHCRDCQRRVQGRHALQTSDAVGVGDVQVGPEALSLAAELNKRMGLSLGHTPQVLELGFGLRVSRAGLCRALARWAGQCAPTYERLLVAARHSSGNGMDETGWRVGGRLQWLHVAVSAHVTVYAILPGRGFEQAATLLGADYQGLLVHDGWAPYGQFTKACQQSCLAPLLRRCKEMAQAASPGAAIFPLRVQALLERSLWLRDRYQRGELSAHGLATARGRLEALRDWLLEKDYRSPSNRRLAGHLRRQQPWLFRFLRGAGGPATNNETERAIRMFVIGRKVWGGNRTWRGPRTQQILASVLRTCHQQGQQAWAGLVALQRSPTTRILDLVPGSRSP